MNRRSILKSLFLGMPSSAREVGSEQAIAGSNADPVGISDKEWKVLSAQDGWQELTPGKTLMNWQIKNDELICWSPSTDATAFLSDYQLSGEAKSFEAEMIFTFNSQLIDQAGHLLNVGFRFSPDGIISEAAQHIDAGLSSNGWLFIGADQGDRLLKEEVLKEPLRLTLSVITQSSGNCFAKLRAFDRSGNTLATLSTTKYTSSEWQGDIGVSSHYIGTDEYDQPSVVISNFKIEGEKLVFIKRKDEPTNYITQK